MAGAPCAENWLAYRELRGMAVEVDLVCPAHCMSLSPFPPPEPCGRQVARTPTLPPPPTVVVRGHLLAVDPETGNLALLRVLDCPTDRDGRASSASTRTALRPDDAGSAAASGNDDGDGGDGGGGDGGGDDNAQAAEGGNLAAQTPRPRERHGGDGDAAYTAVVVDARAVRAVRGESQTTLASESESRVKADARSPAPSTAPRRSPSSRLCTVRFSISISASVVLRTESRRARARRRVGGGACGGRRRRRGGGGADSREADRRRCHARARGRSGRRERRWW